MGPSAHYSEEEAFRQEFSLCSQIWLLFWVFQSFDLWGGRQINEELKRLQSSANDRQELRLELENLDNRIQGEIF